MSQNMLVSEIGDGVTELAGHLVEVDLQDNLFSRWDEIFRLASQLPDLNNLLLHGNKLGDLTSDEIQNNSLARSSSIELSFVTSFLPQDKFSAPPCFSIKCMPSNHVVFCNQSRSNLTQPPRVIFGRE